MAKVIHLFEGYFFLHLVPNGVYVFGTSLNFKFEIIFFEFFPNRFDELLMYFCAISFCFCQPLCYFTIGIRFQILHGQVFHLVLMVYKPNL